LVERDNAVAGVVEVFGAEAESGVALDRARARAPKAINRLLAIAGVLDWLTVRTGQILGFHDRTAFGRERVHPRMPVVGWFTHLHLKVDKQITSPSGIPVPESGHKIRLTHAPPSGAACRSEPALVDKCGNPVHPLAALQSSGRGRGCPP